MILQILISEQYLGKHLPKSTVASHKYLILTNILFTNLHNTLCFPQILLKVFFQMLL